MKYLDSFGSYFNGVKRIAKDSAREAYRSGINGLVGTVLGTSLVLGLGTMGSCDDESNHKTKTHEKEAPEEEPVQEDYSLVFVGESILGSGFEKPEGLKLAVQNLSSSKNYQKAVGLVMNPDDTISSIFSERPTLTNFSNPEFMPQNEPKINGISGTLADINNGNIVINNIYTFPATDVDEFNTMQGSSINGIYTPFGLSLRIQRLGSNYLVSKNPSNKISEISDSLPVGTFAQNDALLGITDMTLGRNGRLYLAQSMLVNCEGLSQNQWTVARSRRMISVDPENLLNPDGSLSYVIEFTLPNGELPIALTTIPEQSCYPTDDMVRIVENSLEGKLANGIDFFASDFLNGKVYSVLGGIASLFRDIPYPTALVMEQNKKILVTRGPVLQGDPASPVFLENSQIIEVDPENPANDLPLYTLNESVGDFQGYLFPENSVQNTWVPTTYSVSLDVAESSTNLTMLLSNTVNGKVTAVQFEKVLTP